MQELIRQYLEELEFKKESFSDGRYHWLRSISNPKTVTKEKIHTAIGYIMAVREVGDRSIGDLKLYLELILEAM